jgi:hypothetical protein
MAKELSSTAKSLLTLLNNVDELIVLSNDRTNAREVMKAFVLYANSKNFPFPRDKVANFYAVLLDAQPRTLSFIVKDMAGDIIKEGYN